MILAPTPREREWWYALSLLAQGLTASATTEALEKDPQQRSGAPPVPDSRGSKGMPGGREGVMGPLILPPSGLVYLDASCLIYSVERIEPYRTLLQPMWEQAQDGNLAIVSSPILVMETLASSAVKLLDASYPESTEGGS